MPYMCIYNNNNNNSNEDSGNDDENDKAFDNLQNVAFEVKLLLLFETTTSGQVIDSSSPSPSNAT